MNIHHLELFYYVARFGGITEAVRKIPYGIQQPAVSAQIRQLEDDLGLTLFQRRPFALTPAGASLYKFIEPFFSNLGAAREKLQGGMSHRIRIGASEVVLRDHLPGILEAVRHDFPKLNLVLRQGYQPDLEQWIQKGEIDLAVTLLNGRLPPGIQGLPLLELPLILLTSRRTRLRSAEVLWEQDRIGETLICLAPGEAICLKFQEQLERLKVDWPPGIEVNSLALIETYVECGYGIGLAVRTPGLKPTSRVKILELEGFPSVTVGVLWRGPLSPLAKRFVHELEERARKFLSMD